MSTRTTSSPPASRSTTSTSRTSRTITSRPRTPARPSERPSTILSATPSATSPTPRRTRRQDTPNSSSADSDSDPMFLFKSIAPTTSPITRPPCPAVSPAVSPTITNLYYLQRPAMMMNLKAKIINHETESSGKIVYVLEVTEEQTGRSKISKLRYSEFKNLHEELEKLVNKLKLHLILPEFPSRKLFGSTNKSEESIFERKKDLNNYLNDLISIEKLYCLDLMKKYFIPEGKAEVQQQKEAQEINMQICIDRYTLVEDVVIYYVRLRDLNSHEEWTFKTRYSELRNVHDALEESSIKNLPPFPKKKIFGITNESPENIEKRREQLEKYFNEIFNSKEVLRSDAIRYFIEESKKQAQRDKELEALRKKKTDKP